MKPVCLITGAAGLLGHALCSLLSKDYSIVAIYRNSIPKHSSQLIRQVAFQESEEVYCIQGDLTNKEDIRRIVDVTIAKFGQIDVVINNAVDYTRRGTLLELFQTDDYANAKLNINSVVPFQLVSYVHQNCWKELPEENLAWNRNVVNISSMSGVNVYAESEPIYSASKSAMNILTLHLAMELNCYRVRANAICPPGFSSDGAGFIALKVKEMMEGSESGKIVKNLY